MGFYFKQSPRLPMRLHFCLQVILHYGNLSCRNTEQAVCETTGQMQWNRGRLQTESVSIVKNYFSHRPLPLTYIIPKSQMRQSQPPPPELLVNTSCAQQIAYSHVEYITCTPSFSQRNQKVERGKVGLEQSVQRVREENHAVKCGFLSTYRSWQRVVSS
jgi:hypothetical protein